MRKAQRRPRRCRTSRQTSVWKVSKQTILRPVSSQAIEQIREQTIQRKAGSMTFFGVIPAEAPIGARAGTQKTHQQIPTQMGPGSALRAVRNDKQCGASRAMRPWIPAYAGTK